MKEKIGVQILLTSGNSILLMQRENPGYCDGMYGLPSGKLEAGESADQCAKREVLEEIGVVVSSLKLVLHLETLEDGKWQHYFFHSNTWIGQIKNCETQKCSDVQFFAKDNLPANIISYVRFVCEHCFPENDDTAAPS